MNSSTSFDVMLNYLPEQLRKLLAALPGEKLKGLMEVRFRVASGVFLVYPDRIAYLMNNGQISGRYGENSYRVSEKEIKNIVERLCHYSVHSCEKELAEGFFVVGNGVRVGVSGEYSSVNGGGLTDYTSLNFRISRSVEGCADPLFSLVYDKNFLICGGVNSGKTTVLRELCRLTGDLRKTTLIDERNEIACLINGVPGNDVGIMTDVIGNCNRSDGIIRAIRTLSPDVIFCDEVASERDADAIIDGLGCGVKFVVTAHGNSYKEIVRRHEIVKLIESGMFDGAVFLKGSSAPSEVREVRRLGIAD